MGYRQIEHKSACPRCVRNGRDRAGDNLHNYGEGNGSFCYSCGYTILSDAEKERRGIGKFEWDDEMEAEVATKEPLTKEELERIKGYTGTKGKMSRGLTDETYKAYGCRFEYDEETSDVAAHYYGVTKDYEPVGFKIRRLPKDFISVGKIGVASDLFGQWKFKTSNSRTILVTAGEVDTLSAYQMLENYRKSKNSDYDPTPVVSSVIGESGSAKQLQKQYEFLNRFDKIIICYDSDQAGKDAVVEVAKVLPKGKMYVMELPMKDTNAMLTAGKEREWINCYFKAKAYTPNGILASTEVMDRIIQEALTPKIPLPPFMHKAQEMMAGGIPLGVIVNLASASGTGKSTIVDECTYYWVFNSPHKIGVVSLESDCGQYGTKILSRHIGRKIDLIEDVEAKLTLLNDPGVVDLANKMWFNEDGSPRWYLVDERDGGLDDLKEQIMNLVIACDCKVIILDPIQDILDGLSNEEQAVFLRWMKGLTKSHKVTFINVNHVRKNSNQQKANSTGADLHEEDIHGSSSLFKSAACNIMFSRNKEAEDEVERNTTYMKIPKCRWTGKTGIAGEYYYESETHTMHDKFDYLSKRNKGF